MQAAERYSDYDNWAWLYNETLGPSYANDKLPLITRALLSRVPSGAALLDLCCGTGHLTRLLLDLGYQVTGLDGSEAMLEFAKQNAPNARFILADARSFDMRDEFQGALCTSAALNHATCIDELQGIFSRVAHSLRSGAIFVFDVNSPESMRLNWCGKPILGELKREYAWICRTYYDGSTSTGSFTVDIYRPVSSDSGDAGSLSVPIHFAADLFTSKNLEELRLTLLDRFDSLSAGWKHVKLEYAIFGHDLVAVKGALLESGFRHVSIQSSSGETYSEGSACFVCER